MPRVLGQSRRSRLPFDFGIAVGGSVALLAVILLSGALANGGGETLASETLTGETLTRNTVRLSLAWYATALCLMMRLGPTDWLATSGVGRLARWCWTWGVVCFLVHLAMAFHYYHHWSHAHAFEHTRAVSGTGEGIYVSYLFTALWLADAIWWWALPAAYAARSAWIDRALHAFMLFIVFNGMVVFENGPIRWAGLLLFVALPAAWLLSRGAPRLRPI
jgi:hypothetical protein